MKRALTRRVPFFVTMLTAALIVVGWRVAGAGPCIRDGQTCRTNEYAWPTLDAVSAPRRA
jgi:hypothetical protein